MWTRRPRRRRRSFSTAPSPNSAGCTPPSSAAAGRCAFPSGAAKRPPPPPSGPAARRSPPRLLDAAAPTTGAPGILLPFFDLLNHGKGTEIEWRGDGQSVAFAAGADGIEAQAEIFNNYGSKANDELLLAHGFALENNEHDRVALKMTVASGDGRRTLGPFYLRRGGAFPRALWRALADPTGDPAASDSDSPPEVDAEAAEILLATLERKRAPFTPSQARPQSAALSSGQRASVAFYRNGQAEILEDAIEALRIMLGYY